MVSHMSCLTEVLPAPEKKVDISIPKNREKIVWLNVFALLYFHLTGVVSFLMWRHLLMSQTWVLQGVLSFWSGYSVTAGAHRLWAHRAYKAKWPLRLFLAIGHSVTFQFDIYEWVRTHRVHHKFTDTDADPHNSTRGFFFSHIGWIMLRKHKDVIVKGRTVDMSDIEGDWVVMWQKRLYLFVGPLFCFILPTVLPIYFWGEDYCLAWCATVCRFLLTTHLSGLVNSVAHMWGTKPYDKHMTSADNVTVAFLAGGEGWHNYHHAFPWDYKAAELGNYKFNMTTGFLDLCGRLGLAYDFKVASPELIRRRILRTGDGSHTLHSHEGEVWGWGDEDMSENDKNLVTIINPEMRSKTETKKLQSEKLRLTQEQLEKTLG